MADADAPGDAEAAPIGKSRSRDDMLAENVIGALTRTFGNGRTLYGMAVTSVATLYAAIDKDGSGTIEVAELRAALQRFDMKLTAEQLDTMMAILDKDDDNEISYVEMAAAFDVDEPAGSYEAAMAAAIMKRGQQASQRSLNDSQEPSHEESEASRDEKRREAEQASVINVMLNAVRGQRTLFGQKLDKPQALFDAMDKDGGGSVSVQEFGDAIQRLGLGLSEEQKAAVVATLDADGNGEIVYEEFVDRLWRHVEAAAAKEEQEEPLSALQEQNRHFAEQQQASEEVKAAPTEEQAEKRAKALVANRMEVLRGSIGSGRKLYGVEVTSVATLFCTIDKDGSGTVDTAELREALERMGLGLSGEQLDLIIAAIDTDEDLDLSYEELCAAVGMTETEETYAEAKIAAAQRRKLQERKERKKERVLTTAEKDAHLKVRADARVQAARMNIMRVIRLATKKIPPTALLPRGGHRSLYGKKLTDMMSVFEAIDQDNSGGITTDELMHALMRLGANVPEEQLREMVQAFDEDGNGVLDYHELFLAAENERISEEAKKKKREKPMKQHAPPTSQGGAATLAGGATRRRRAGGGWHVSSRPTIWSQQLRANPSTIGRSVKAGTMTMSLGAVGTLVSGTTDAPCWSMSAASYVSPSYDPSPPKSGFGVSEGDPIMWWPPTKLGSTSPIFGSVESLSMNVPLGKSPQVQVRLADGTVRSASAGDSVRRKRRINALSPGMHKPVSAGIRKKKAAAAAAAHIHMREKRGESLSLKAQAARSSRSSKLEELEMIEIKTPTGKLLKMEVTSRETPGELKHRLEETLGPVGGHRVVFAGKSLEEDKTLGESGVQNNAILRLQKPSAWSTHLKRYTYSTLQYWDKSTQQAQTRVKKTKPPPRPRTQTSSAEDETEVDHLVVAAAAAHKKSEARILQRKVHAEFTKRHVSARAAFPAFVSRDDNLATVDDLICGFVELGVQMPLLENGKRSNLKDVITDVLRDLESVKDVGDGLLAIDGNTFHLWIAPEPSELASVYTEKILAKAPEAQLDGQPLVSKAVERAQRTVDAIENQLNDMNRQISEAEAEHNKALEEEETRSEKRAVALQRLEVDFSHSQLVREERAAELQEALEARQATVEARREAEAARHKDAYNARIAHVNAKFEKHTGTPRENGPNQQAPALKSGATFRDMAMRQKSN